VRAARGCSGRTAACSCWRRSGEPGPNRRAFLLATLGGARVEPPSVRCAILASLTRAFSLSPSGLRSNARPACSYPGTPSLISWRPACLDPGIPSLISWRPACLDPGTCSLISWRLACRAPGGPWLLKKRGLSSSAGQRVSRGRGGTGWDCQRATRSWLTTAADTATAASSAGLAAEPSAGCRFAPAGWPAATGC
jgi:hypothetical protein